MTPPRNVFWDNYFSNPDHRNEIDRIGSAVYSRRPAPDGSYDAKDLVQAVMANLLRSHEVNISSPGGHIRVSLTNLAHDWEKRIKGEAARHRQLALEESSEEADGATQSHAGPRRHMRARLQTAARELKPADRHVLSLFSVSLAIARLRKGWRSETDDRVPRGKAYESVRLLLAAEGRHVSEQRVRNLVSEILHALVEILEREHVGPQHRLSLSPDEISKGFLGHEMRRAFEWDAIPWNPEVMESLFGRLPTPEKELLSQYYRALHEHAGEKAYDASWSPSAETCRELREKLGRERGLTSSDVERVESSCVEKLVHDATRNLPQTRSPNLLQLLRRWFVAMPPRSP